MKRLRVAAALAALTALSAGSAFAQQTRQIAFKASYAGTAVTKVTGDRVDYNAHGTGTGTLVKSSKIAGIGAGDKSSPPCAPFNGPGSITSKAGKLKLSILRTSRACAASETDTNNVSLSGTAKVLGGTLKFKQARGSLHFSGHFTRSTGHFTLKLVGRLTY